jgi:hypothetical protein
MMTLSLNSSLVALGAVLAVAAAATSFQSAVSPSQALSPTGNQIVRVSPFPPIPPPPPTKGGGANLQLARVSPFPPIPPPPPTKGGGYVALS